MNKSCYDLWSTARCHSGELFSIIHLSKCLLEQTLKGSLFQSHIWRKKNYNKMFLVHIVVTLTLHCKWCSPHRGIFNKPIIRCNISFPHQIPKFKLLQVHGNSRALEIYIDIKQSRVGFLKWQRNLISIFLLVELIATANRSFKSS